MDNYAIESFIDRCDELMLPAEEGFSLSGMVKTILEKIKALIARITNFIKSHLTKRNTIMVTKVVAETYRMVLVNADKPERAKEIEERCNAVRNAEVSSKTEFMVGIKTEVLEKEMTGLLSKLNECTSKLEKAYGYRGKHDPRNNFYNHGTDKVANHKGGPKEKIDLERVNLLVQNYKNCYAMCTHIMTTGKMSAGKYNKEHADRLGNENNRFKKPSADED